MSRTGTLSTTDQLLCPKEGKSRSSRRIGASRKNGVCVGYPFLKSPKDLLRQSGRVEIRGGKT